MPVAPLPVEAEKAVRRQIAELKAPTPKSVRIGEPVEIAPGLYFEVVSFTIETSEGTVRCEIGARVFSAKKTFSTFAPDRNFATVEPMSSDPKDLAYARGLCPNEIVSAVFNRFRMFVDGWNARDER